jgi:hypothetical protein
MARVDNNTRQNKVYAARRLIYEKKYGVTAVAIEDLLKDEWPSTNCCTPVTAFDIVASLTILCQNAFSDRLAPMGFDFYSIFVVDLMHDFELGDWRALFIHLLRILDAVDANLLLELDRR